MSSPQPINMAAVDDSPKKKGFGLFHRKGKASGDGDAGRSSKTPTKEPRSPRRSKKRGSSQFSLTGLDDLPLKFVRYRIIIHHGVVTAADSNGLSDAYVKLSLGNKKKESKEKSKYTTEVIEKSLTPYWAEEVILTTQQGDEKLEFTVMDKDKMGSDFLGGDAIELEDAACDKPMDFKVQLRAQPEHHKGTKALSAKSNYNNGEIGFVKFIIHRLDQPVHHAVVDATDPEAPADAAGSDPQASTKRKDNDSSDKKKSKKKPKVFRGTLIRVACISARGLPPRRLPGGVDALCTMKMSSSTKKPTVRKSRKIKNTCSPEWKQEFEFHCQDEYSLISFTVYDRKDKSDGMLGRCMLDTYGIELNETHEHVLNLGVDEPNEDGTIRIAVTVQQLYMMEDDDEGEKENDASLPGHLLVHIIKARNLAAMDGVFNKSSDPFCMVEVDNNRKRTHAIAKSLEPKWDKELAFVVRDVFGDVSIKIYDEDGDGSMDFLGMVIIPLSHINNGEREWFALKTEDGLFRAKGEVEVALQFEVTNLQAGFQHVLSTRIEKFVGNHEKLSLGRTIKKVKGSIARLTDIMVAITSVFLVVSKALSWEYGVWWTLAIMAGFGFVALNFELWMLPMGLLLGMASTFYFSNAASEEAVRLANEPVDPEPDDDEDDEGSAEVKKQKPKKDKQGIFAKINAIGQLVQDKTDIVASALERIMNLFNWTVPLLTELIVIVLCVLALVLYYMPLKWAIFGGGEALFLLTGKAKLMRAIRGKRPIPPPPARDRPNPLPLDMLARVPSTRDLQITKRLLPSASTRMDLARHNLMVQADAHGRGDAGDAGL